MSEMRIYPDWEPQIVTLSGNLPDGTITSVDYYYDEKGFLYPVGPSGFDYVKSQESTHIRCECGEVFEKNYYTKCKKCRDKEALDKYLALPVVPISYPCFVNDELCFDECELEDYILNEEITDTSILEIHPAIKVKFDFDVIEYLNDWACDNGIEDLSFSPSDEKLLDNLSLDIELMVNTNLNWYEADDKHRISIKE